MSGQAPCSAEICFRALELGDLGRLQRWLNDPEVVRWYSRGRPTLRAVRRKYGPRIEGRSGTRVFVVALDGSDAGLCQTYRFEDYIEYAAVVGAAPDWAGIDYFIGEARFRGHGLAHRIIDCFVREIVFGAPDIRACLSSTDPDNDRSIRALERAGFEFLRDVPTPQGEVEHLLIRRR